MDDNTNLKFSPGKSVNASEKCTATDASDAEESDASGASVSDGSGSDTDASEGRSSCPICLRSFVSQEIGFPQDCASTEHYFCASCIKEWANNVSTCPIDRTEFTSICILDNWTNRQLVKTVKVEKKTYAENETITTGEAEDLTYCEICRSPHREYMMLLCDDCDRGFHMDCLTPQLREIPTGSWFCPRCDPMHSDTEEGEDEQEPVSVSEDEYDGPRIIRTRQSERIRTAILARALSPEPTPVISQPGPSRTASVLERVQRRLRTSRQKRRRRRRVRAIVEEYEINSGDEKFPITRRRRRVIRRKRRKMKKKRATKKASSGNCAQRREFHRDLDTPAGEIGLMRYRAGIPRLDLFGSSNRFNFSPVASEEEAEAESIAENATAGDVLTAIRNIRPIGARQRALLKQKIVEPVRADPVNILDMIMESQERWHSRSISNNCTLKDGKPVFDRKPTSTPSKIVVTQAGLNGTSSNQQMSSQTSQERQTDSSNNHNSTAGYSNTDRNSSGLGSLAVSGGSSSSGNNNDDGAANIRFSFNPLPQRTAAQKKFGNNDDHEDEDSCPNLSIYSSESVNAANKTKEKSPTQEGDDMDVDMDLVQESEDDDFELEPEVEPNKVESDKTIEDTTKKSPTPPPTTPASKWKPLNEDVLLSSATLLEEQATRVLQLYDSDGGLEDLSNDEELDNILEPEINTDDIPLPTTDAPPPMQTEPDRSFTPCLDENPPKDIETGAISPNSPNPTSSGKSSKGNYPVAIINDTEEEDENAGTLISATGSTCIDGIEMELISDEEDSNLKGSPKGERFKRIPTKDRNYRGDIRERLGGKKRARSRSKSSSSSDRSRKRKSEDKENRKATKDRKRKELPRYDVRTVVGKKRDPFGRNRNRDKKQTASPSPPPPLLATRRSRSESRPRRSISKRKSLSRKRSTSRRRSGSKRRSTSRHSFSISRSPSLSHSPSPRRTPPPAHLRHRASTPRQRSFTPLRRYNRSPSRSPSKSPLVVGLTPRRGAGYKSPILLVRKSLSRSLTPPPKRKESRKKKDKSKKKRHKDKGKKRKTRDESRSPSWSRNDIPDNDNVEPSWTPPLGAGHKTAENLRVVVNNKDRSAKKKEKRRKNKEKKSKDVRRPKTKRREKSPEPARPATTNATTSKEVFASGENILVSVSFGHVQPEPERRVERDPTKTLQLHNPAAKPRRQHKKTDAKPVAIIDLDGSPCREVPASPVIILTDSDHEQENETSSHPGPPNKESLNRVAPPQQEVVTIDEVIRPSSPPESPPQQEQLPIIQPVLQSQPPPFRAPAGPKTPPEPATIKFSMSSNKPRMRPPITNIFDVDETSDDNAPRNEEQSNKVGPNTPPEPNPISPDAYDPFEPTKSPSEHSDGHDRENGLADDGPASRSSTPPLEETEQMLNAAAAANASGASKEPEKTINPVDLVMSLINKGAATTSESQRQTQELVGGDQSFTIEATDEFTEVVADANNQPTEKTITILSNVVVNTPSKYSSLLPVAPRATATSTTPHKTPTRSPASFKSQTTKPLGLKQLNLGGGSIISKLPLPPRSNKPIELDFDSPYSPGSSDFDDLFEPPSSTTDTYKPSHKQNVTSTSNNRGGKTEVFDSLFGSTSPVHKFTSVTSTFKTTSKTTKSLKASGSLRKSHRHHQKYIDDDDVPSSAVELQVKDKLLRKLNRQERVIEEVKLVIKPHYNKKRINKEEYKEIMRKAVPKICHSKSGEINPVKIANLVEAYVRKVRHRRKAQMKGQPQGAIAT